MNGEGWLSKGGDGTNTWRKEGVTPREGNALYTNGFHLWPQKNWDYEAPFSKRKGTKSKICQGLSGKGAFGEMKGNETAILCRGTAERQQPSRLEGLVLET